MLLLLLYDTVSKVKQHKNVLNKKRNKKKNHRKDRISNNISFHPTKIEIKSKHLLMLNREFSLSLSFNKRKYRGEK